MTPNTSKLLHILALVAYMILVVGPPAVSGFTSIGLPAWAHGVSALLGILGIPVLRQMLPIPTVASSLRVRLAASKLAVSALLFGALFAGCAAFSKDVAIMTPAGACVATQLLEGGATDPLQIVAACAGVTIEDVVQVVENLMAAQPPDDAGAPTATKARLASVHVRALGMKKAGGK